MPRYRSIKPSYWSDGKILDLSDSCALFFIALWNFSDDEGKVKNNTKELSSLTARWRRDKVKKFILSLVDLELVRLSRDLAWIQVTNWSHQKISKPLQPKVKAEDIQWLNAGEHQNKNGLIRESSRQGEERRGKREERSSLRERSTESPAKKGSPKKAKASTKIIPELIAEYCDLWREKYKAGKSPPITQKSAGILKRIGNEFGLTRSKFLLRAFFDMPDSWLVKRKHPIDSFESKLNEIAAFADSGNYTTAQDSRNFDNRTALQQQLARIDSGEL